MFISLQTLMSKLACFLAFFWGGTKVINRPIFFFVLAARGLRTHNIKYNIYFRPGLWPGDMEEAGYDRRALICEVGLCGDRGLDSGQAWKRSQW